ncbi:hypothetical protein SGLAM104S_08610 [Streptomyces glaucescens]
MNAPHPPKVAGIDSTVPAPAHTVAPARRAPASPPPPPRRAPSSRTASPAGSGTSPPSTNSPNAWPARARSRTCCEELGRAGAALVGARRGLVALEPADGVGRRSTVGYGLGPADLGHIETVPRGALPYGGLLDALPGGPGGVAESLPPTCSPRRGSTPATGRSPPASATPRATPSPWPPRPRAAWARSPGSKMSPRNPPNGSATSSACTSGTPRSTSPGSSKSSARARGWRRWPRNCSLPACPRWPGCSSPPGTAPARAGAATGTTRCRCRTPPSGSLWGP